MEQQYGEIAHADLRAEHVYTKVNGQRIHCVVAGKGQPVLLIPGWPQTRIPALCSSGAGGGGFSGDSGRPSGYW